MKALLLFLALLIFISGCSRTINCGSNIECFKNNAETCTKSKFLLNQDGNNILITLRGINNDKCGVSFKVMELNEEEKNNYPTESSELKGKTLNCLVPIKYKDANNWLGLIDVNEKFDEYCSGQIKDLAKGPLKEVLKNEFEKISK